MGNGLHAIICPHCGRDALVPVRPREPDPRWRLNGLATGTAAMAELRPVLRPA